MSVDPDVEMLDQEPEAPEEESQNSASESSDGEEPEREQWRRVRAVQLHVQTRLWRTKKEVSTLLRRHRSDVSDAVGIGSTRSRE